MKNKFFNIEIDKNTGNVTHISNNEDPYNMNWCAADKQWGRVRKINWDACANDCAGEFGELEGKKAEFVSAEIFEDKAVSKFVSKELEVTVTRYFAENGNFVENFCCKNISGTVITLNRDTFGIELPFNDMQESADECMIRHCNTHIWCGHNIAWINALKMGASEINLGLYLKKGALDCYEIDGCIGRNRGIFIVDPESILLKDGEEYQIEWELFWHTGTNDFLNKLKNYKGYIGVEAEHFTVFENEQINFTVTADELPTVTLNNKPIKVEADGNVYKIEYKPTSMGEHKFMIKAGSKSTWAVFMVKMNFKDLLEKRIHFIVRNQQCRDEESPLYGAFLIYDNEYDAVYFDNFNPDHNACRERMNIPLLLMKYLQIKDDKEVREAIDLYIEFVFREFYDENTGEIFNTIGKKRDQIRLYNAPGVITLFTEMYFVTHDKKYLEHILKMAEHYYGIGGKKCYANGFTFSKVMKAFYMGGSEDEIRKMLNCFDMHTENVISIGVSYPPHEAIYEQTIVTPAVQYISDMGVLKNSTERYAEEVKNHIECLERFSGMQPDYRLYEIAVRYWDDYWFGKAHLKGDTLPHHLSVLTARAYTAYAKLSGNKEYIKKAENCIRDCMCLIKDDGRGSAAYVYPYRVNGKRGELFDSWSNDQDLVLYDALYFADETGLLEA